MEAREVSVRLHEKEDKVKLKELTKYIESLNQ